MQWRERIRHMAGAAALPAVLAAALAVRVWSIGSGVPHAVGIDEPAVVDRALRILNTGDWNTHIFDYPTLVIYLHALAAIPLFLGGSILGAWTSLQAFDIAAVYTSARLLTAATGVITVLLVFWIGERIGGRALGLLAAAQLAVLPMHVRESHFALTDVPVTALATLAVWLSMRAADGRTIASYAAAGAACGLAAAAKYNGVVACVAPAAAWLLREGGARDRIRKGIVAAACATGAFLLAAPYAALDYPAFLSGFAAQAARFSGARPPGDQSWLLYLKHLALMGRLWMPAAALGIAIVVWRRSTRTPAVPMLAFGAAYFYTLATHRIVFARYALPLVPVVCVLAAVPIVEAARTARRFRRSEVARAVLAAGAVLLTVPFAMQSIEWVRQFAAPDTRQVAAEWMRSNVPAATRVVVENSGPTYLRELDLDVITVELLVEHPLGWYREQRVGYFVISSRDAERNKDYLAAGPVVFEVDPSPSRWGPPIRIVRATHP